MENKHFKVGDEVIWHGPNRLMKSGVVQHIIPAGVVPTEEELLLAYGDQKLLPRVKRASPSDRLCLGNGICLPVTRHYDPLTGISSASLALWKKNRVLGVRLATIWNGWNEEPSHLERLREYKGLGWSIVIDTPWVHDSPHQPHRLAELGKWFKKYKVPYNELWTGPGELVPDRWF